MADYMVIRASGGVPNLGDTVSADIHRADYPNAAAAAAGAATALNAAPGQFLYVFLSSGSTRYVLSFSATVG